VIFTLMEALAPGFSVTDAGLEATVQPVGSDAAMLKVVAPHPEPS
jgi:hypothetical protein